MQQCWLSVVYNDNFESTKSGLQSKRLTHVVTAAQAHSDDWINAIPIAQFGTKLNDEEVRYSVALRIGLVVCQPHRCRCGYSVLPDGLHPFLCWLSAGRFPRHAAINDVTKLALDSSGFHSVLEPVGLDRGDGRRTDGITVLSFRQGEAFVWDATCTTTFAPSSLFTLVTNHGSTDIAPKVRKRLIYANLTQHYISVPVVV